jgi:hypothetical protein
MKLLERALALLLVAAAPLTARPAAPAYQYSRTLQVDAAGWVRFQVPAEVLVRLSSGMDDLALEDPAGQGLPLFPWKGPSEPAPSLRTAALVDMATVPGGWRVVADLGPSRSRHRLLAVDVPGTGLAEAVTVEVSPDGKAWRLAARGSMFRLDRWGMTSKTYLEYPPTSDRYLRVFWPQSAGFPTWKSLWVADWPDGAPGEIVQEPLTFSSAGTSARETCYWLEMPRAALDRPVLTLDLALPYPVHARLLSAVDGGWNTITEASLLPDQTPLIPLPPMTPGSSMILALSAGQFETPALRGVNLRHEPRWLMFKATGPGAYTLRYGALGTAPQSAAVEALPVMPPASVVVLGQEKAQSLPDLPAPTLAMGAALPEVTFTWRCPVTASGAAPQSLVSLEVPPACYAVARRDLADLRLAYSGRQVPFVLWLPSEPVQALELKGATPKTVKGEHRSEIELDLANDALPLVSVELCAPAAPFSRPVSLLALEATPSPEGRHGDSWVPLDSGSWRCPGVSEIPTRFVLRGSQVDGHRLRLVFEDGDNAPLPSVDVVVWRRRHVLLFPWAGEGVQLCAGARNLGAPTYDLAELRDEIIRRPTRPAAAGSAVGEAAPSHPRGDSMFGRGTLLAVLLGVGVLLVVILARSLRKPAAGTPRGA